MTGNIKKSFNFCFLCIGTINGVIIKLVYYILVENFFKIVVHGIYDVISPIQVMYCIDHLMYFILMYNYPHNMYKFEVVECCFQIGKFLTIFSKQFRLERVNIPLQIMEANLYLLSEEARR